LALLVSIPSFLVGVEKFLLMRRIFSIAWRFGEKWETIMYSTAGFEFYLSAFLAVLYGLSISSFWFLVIYASHEYDIFSCLLLHSASNLALILETHMDICLHAPFYSF